MQERNSSSKSPSSRYLFNIFFFFPTCYSFSYEVSHVTLYISGVFSSVLQGPPGRSGLPGADGLAGPPGTMLMLPVSAQNNAREVFTSHLVL